MNKRFYFLMVLLLVAPWIAWGQSVWDGTTDTEWYGDGSASEFTINTAEELAGLAELVNESPFINFSGKTIKLGADIFLNEHVLNENGELNSGNYKEWKPIGDVNSIAFRGTFDGNNHTIWGLYIKDEKERSTVYGLFGYVGSKGYHIEAPECFVQNVNIKDSYIDCSGGRHWIGGICARLGNESLLSNCSFDGLIIAKNSYNIGGICGYSDGIVENCYNKGLLKISWDNITGTNSFYPTPYTVSGITSFFGGTTDAYPFAISNCYNEGNIDVEINGATIQPFFLIGGVSSSYGNITSSYNKGEIKVSGDNNEAVICIGGILGMLQSQSNDKNNIQYCYNYGSINSTVSTNLEEEGMTVYGAGSIIGLASTTNFSTEDVYYLQNENTKAIGGYFMGSSDAKVAESKEPYQFSNGEVAWLLRDGGFGQALNENGEYINDATPVLLTFDENKGKEVYKLTLNLEGKTEINGKPIYRNAEECNLLPTATYDKIMEGAEPGQDLVWTNEAGEVFSGNKYTVTTDETLTAKLEGVYEINKVVTPEGAGNINVKETAANGEIVTFSIETNDGYEFVSISRDGQIEVDENGDGLYTFTMPANNVTITATFKKIETGDGGNEDYDGDLTKRYRLYLADQDFYQNDEYDEEGLVLYSRHDKKYTGAGGSFTVYYEKDGEMNAGDYRIFWSKSANGEYKEVKLDEVSGYYQIRNVQSDVYVKIYGRDGFPVSNEAIEATEARAYAQANKIIVVTREPMDVQIVSMAGAVVGNAKVVGQQEFGNLAEGVYIVRLGDTVVKLQVRN